MFKELIWSSNSKGTFSSPGFNLIGNNSGCEASFPEGNPNTNNDIVGKSTKPIDAMLGPLQNNGGPTQTHALLSGSQAIDAGNSATPGSDGNSCEPTGQRELSRPADGDGKDGARCDIGAFELGPATLPGAKTVQSGPVTITFTNVTAAGNTTVIPIDPTTAGTLPSQFKLSSESVAFDIITTAKFTGPITVCIQVPSVTDPVKFDGLQILQNGQQIPQSQQTRDFATKTICATVNSLSLFVVAELLNNVNSLVTFTPIPGSFSTTSDTSVCPSGFVGKFSFDAALTNISEDSSLSDLLVEVTELTNGNLLQNADGGPGGVGARLTVPNVGDFSDGVLSPGESVDVPFVICLKNKDPFKFFVDVLGIVE